MNERRQGHVLVDREVPIHAASLNKTSTCKQNSSLGLLPSFSDLRSPSCCALPPCSEARMVGLVRHEQLMYERSNELECV
jgi:hypothetical protein